MLGIDTRAARIVWTVFLFALVIATAYAIRETLVVFVIALFFAYMLSPLVELVASHLPKRISPMVALAIVYLALLGVLIAAGLSIGSRIAEEAGSLANRIPDFFKNQEWVNKIPLPGWLEPMRAKLLSTIQKEFSAGGQNWVHYITSAGSKLVTGISLVFYVVLIPILAFFFLKDGKTLREDFLGGLTGGRQRELVDDILKDVHVLLGQYIRALVILSMATFVSYSLFLSITGAPYSILLAGAAALLEFIPVVGPLTAGVSVIVIAGLSGYTHVLWFFGFWLGYRLLQDYVISPYLMSSGVELHPLLVLFGVLAGERIAGVPGMFLSVPVIATLRVIYVRALRARRQKELGNLAT